MPADYGRVRSALRKLSLEESLVHVWQYSRLVSDGVALPYGYNHRDRNGHHKQLERYLFPHEIDLLARELLLHADRSGRPCERSLARWGDLTDTLNAIKTFADDSFDPNVDGGIMLTLHRIAHQQFPRFSRTNGVKMGRYLALYRSPDLKTFFESKLGISVDAYFILTFAAIASSWRRPRMNTTTDYTVLGLGSEETARFFDRIVGALPDVRAKLIQDQRLNDCWEYTFNAIHYKPLISLDPKRPERVYCPSPPALERRLTEGIYYDLPNSRTFARAFGKAVEDVSGQMLISLRPKYTVQRPEPEHVGRQRFDGTDWIVSSPEGQAYVECKGKRLSLAGTLAENLDELRSQLAILADAIVQNYKNISRAIERRKTSGQPPMQFYCVVITLEDWFLFSEITSQMLHDHVVSKLGEAQLSNELLDEVPYRVLGFEAAMYCCAALLESTMDKVFGLTNDPRFVGLAYINDLRDRFPDVQPHIVGNFDAEFDALLDPVIAAGKKATGVA